MQFRIIDGKNEGPWRQAYTDGKENAVMIIWNSDPKGAESVTVEFRPDQS